MNSILFSNVAPRKYKWKKMKTVKVEVAEKLNEEMSSVFFHLCNLQSFWWRHMVYWGVSVIIINYIIVYYCLISLKKQN